MPQQAYDYNYSQYGKVSYTQAYNYGKIYPYRKKVLKKPVKKKNPLKFILRKLTVFAILMIFMPYAFNCITKSVFAPSPYKNIKADLTEYAFPSYKYLSNAWFMGERSFRFAADKKHALMLPLKESVNMPSLKSDLLNLMESYPQIQPAIYFWDFDTHNFVDINASKIYSAASIIKIPVLIDLFRAVENNSLTLDDNITLKEYYRAEGSGSLQYKGENSLWSIDKLAEIMITESDNSATNMLMSVLGGTNGVNQSIRDWGIKNTEIENWLPDYEGENHSTAKELAQMLYNIESNDKFLSDYSRKKIYNYMGHVHNNRLIQAGLGKGSKFYHKTGDIGTMLGDAGIVITPNGKKYIVVILANRPKNDVAGKDFIVKASEIIYNYVVK